MNTKRWLITFLSSFLALSVAQAKIHYVPLSDLKPQYKHIRVNDLITHILTTYHYKKMDLNDALSSSIYDHYFKNLDQNRIYFLKTDIEEFEQYRYRIDDAIRNSNLNPAFDIFVRYRQRVDERINYAINELNHSFNFNKDETFRFDRREDDWAANKKELDEIWRKRVKNDYLNLKLADKEKEEIEDILRKRYKRIRNNVFQLNSNDVFQSFINAYTTSVEPHTTYFSPRASENFDISMRLSLEGIGAVLRAENDYTLVVKVIAGGPADLSGQIHADDKIIAVGQEDSDMVDIIGWRLDDVVDLIRGKKGTQIRLELLPKDIGAEGPSKLVTLIRDKIKLEEQDASSKVIELPENQIRIGVIDLPAFYIDFAAQAKGVKDYKSTSRDVRKLIQDVQADDIDGLIIDLRGNGGGSLSEALELTGLFIDRGPIVQTKNASGKIDINYDPEPGVVYTGPLAVLVDANSASASEIFAGAIQDYRRGIIIGEPTFGKGTVQNVIDLNRFIKYGGNDYGRLKTTIAQFYRVNGKSNQYKGVVPDIILLPTDESEDRGERSYKNALPWDKIKPARYHPASAPIDIFDVARQEHEKRIKENDLFQLLIKDLELQREIGNKKEVSLLEKKRKQERERLMAAKKEVKNAIRAAMGLPPEEDKDLAENSGSNDDEETMDIVLQETAKILNDLIVPPAKHVDSHTVETAQSFALDKKM